jgi:vacuolar-type H+-ATPase subunit I/STV1
VPVSIVTFPFLFGMMFGDMGHGSLLLTTAITIVFLSDTLKKTSLAAIADFRYLLLIMGIMSTYCGLVYNEFFAIPLNIFDSCYFLDQRQQWNPYLEDQVKNITEDDSLIVKGEFVYLRKDFECTYPVGFDPVWGLTSNKLMYSNNIKMKLSVIFGVLHMTIGIFHKGANSLYFKRFADFWFEVVTGTIILLGLFGWMDLLVFAKWFISVDIEDTGRVDLTKYPKYNDTVGWADENELVPIYKYNGDFMNENLPSVVNTMIVAFFNGGDYTNGKPKDEVYLTPLVGKDNEEMYQIAIALIIVVAILVPVMLCVKPCCFRGAGSEDDDEAGVIEFSDLNKNDDANQNLLGNGGNAIQRDSNEGENSSKKLTDDMMQKRQQ